MNDDPNVRRSHDSYSTTAKVLHWVLAALIIVQVVLAQLAQQAKESDRTLDQLALLANHKSLGLTILALVIVRLAWRLKNPPPPLPEHMSSFQRAASHLSHVTLYILMFGLPLSGVVISFTSAYGLSWFNLFEVPRLMAQDELLNIVSKDVHALLGYALLAVFAVHVSAALFHHFIVKDTVLSRMASRSSALLFALLLAGLIATLTPSASNQVTEPAAMNPESIMTRATRAPTSKTDLWNIDYEKSYIQFSAEQAGAKFRGEWQEWRADISLTENPQLQVTIDVEVNVATPDTRDDERDTAMQDADWFDVAKYPASRFVLSEATPNEDGSYTSNAQLTIKELTTPVVFTFRIDSSAGKKTLTGSARLDRMAMKIGTGEWADTSWVGQYVDVDVKVVTR